ncbi:MAG: hypothetical protein M3040_06465 [Bacteroidota bacterium]|nr:hypothetical protein [Bacteroidota bacterium]
MLKAVYTHGIMWCHGYTVLLLPIFPKPIIIAGSNNFLNRPNFPDLFAVHAANDKLANTHAGNVTFELITPNACL